MPKGGFMWNKNEIKVIKSKGNSGAVVNYRDNLLVPENIIWPPIEIVSRLYKSEHISDFDESFQSELQKELGYYTNLQSINSEDALTWSLFGYISKQDNETRTKFVNELLEKLNFDNNQKKSVINLWTRIPHPDTFGRGGPEIDVFIQSEEYIFLIECKYKSEIGKNQGKEKNKDQLQIRSEWCNKIGKKIFPKHKFIVLLIGEEKPEFPLDESVKFISWDELSKFESIPHKEEFNNYYAWKKSFSDIPLL